MMKKYFIFIGICFLILAGVGCRSLELSSLLVIQIPKGPSFELPRGYDAAISGSEVQIRHEAGQMICARLLVVDEPSISRAIESHFQSQGIATCTEQECITNEEIRLPIVLSSGGRIVSMPLPSGMTSYVLLAKTWQDKTVMLILCGEWEKAFWLSVMREIK